MGRQFRWGPRQVINDLLNVRDALFTRVLDEVQPTADVRALRPWEEYQEQVLRWWVAVQVAAVAGQFSALQIGGLDGITLPNGSLWTLDYYNVTGSVNLRQGASAAGIVTQPPGPFWQDMRLGPNASPVPIVLRTGSNAASTGVLLDDIANQIARQDVGFVSVNGAGVIPGPGVPATENLTFWTNAVNTSMVVMLRGRIIVAQQ